MSRITTIGCEAEHTDVSQIEFTGLSSSGAGTWATILGRLGLGLALRGQSNAGNGNFFATLHNQIISNTNLATGGTFGVSGTTYFCRAYMRAVTPVTTATEVLRYNATGTRLAVKLAPDNTLQLWETISNVQIGSSSPPISVDGTTWYRLELSAILSGTNLIGGTFRLNGSPIAVASGLTGTGAAWNWQFGAFTAPGANVVIDFDDIAVNTGDAGAGQTGFPGEGKIVLLSPISDNARGANWVAGAGATTNLFDALDNHPPTGLVLASATNTSQIKNVTSDTTGNYDANMTSYATAGITPFDVIMVVHPLWVVGGSSVTSVSHAMLLVSNPAANGGVASTLAAAAAAGTYPTGWIPGCGLGGQIVHQNGAPGITLGTSPVMRGGKRTASTSAAMFAFMGVYVDYVPAAVPPRGLAVEQAVNRGAIFCLGEKWARRGRLWVPRAPALALTPN